MFNLKPLIIMAITIFPMAANAQNKACCSTATSGEFAMLGTDKVFQAAHVSPEPFNFIAMKGMMVSFPTTDGGKGNAFMVPAEKKTDNYLLVIHEWWGLNDYIKKETEKLAEELPGVNVIALDLYDGKVATTPDAAGKMMQEVKKERAEAIILGTLSYIRTNATVQTIGWCFGGGWSMQAAMLAGEKTKGCVIYYGMPETDEKKLKGFNAPVLGIFAANDGWINKDVVDNFEKQMKSLNKSVDVHRFNADHAFANPSNPKYDVKASAEAHQLSLDFIKKNFNK
jgi:carboxymethylenebutenolidase